MPFLFGKKTTVIFLVFIFAAFGSGFYFGQLQVSRPILGVENQEVGQPTGVDFSLFWDAWRVIQENHVDKSKLDLQKMLYGAISGMVGSLNDPYTVFLPPEDAKIFKEDVSGEFQGVGMEIGIRDDRLTVIAPLEDTPAQKAGLRAGDKIVKIDGKETEGITIEEAVKLIRGPKGTRVTLTISREGWKETKDFSIIRDVIKIPSVKLEFKDNNTIAYIKIYHFSGNAGANFGVAALQILNSPAEKIVLDLRNNPGGYLEIAQNIAGWFLEKGEIVAIEDFGNGKIKKYKAEGNSGLASYPLVILINQGSASASEILAGALRDNRGIKLIGETSFGKGSVQELKDLKGGSSLKVTIARWLTPKRKTISGQGLVPDIKIEMTDKDYEEGKDPQLEKALEILGQ
jgi:carboxyl-terminal processing protease